MTSYRGRHAEYYDVFYQQKPYEEEARFVYEALGPLRVGGRPFKLLELACGTGTHALQLAKLGCNVTATDSSPEMISAARVKAKSADLPAQFHEQDMRTLSVPVVPFDGVVCLFDSIGYVQTDEALDQVFQGVHDNLSRGGRFVFEFWHAPAMLKGYDPVRVRRFPINGGTLLRVSETTLLPDRSLARVAYEIYELRNDSTYAHLSETQTNRYFTVPEMQGWAAKHGFSPLAFYSGFNREMVTDDTWHVVTVWEKP